MSLASSVTRHALMTIGVLAAENYFQLRGRRFQTDHGQKRFWGKMQRQNNISLFQWVLCKRSSIRTSRSGTHSCTYYCHAGIIVISGPTNNERHNNVIIIILIMCNELAFNSNAMYVGRQFEILLCTENIKCDAQEVPSGV